MRKGTKRVKQSPAEYYDRRGVLGELKESPVEFALKEERRRQILGGKRTKRKPVAKPVQQREAPRQYRRDEIQRFLKEDRLDPRTAAKVRRLLRRKRPE